MDVALLEERSAGTLCDKCMKTESKRKKDYKHENPRLVLLLWLLVGGSLVVLLTELPHRWVVPAWLTPLAVVLGLVWCIVIMWRVQVLEASAAKTVPENRPLKQLLIGTLAVIWMMQTWLWCLRLVFTPKESLEVVTGPLASHSADRRSTYVLIEGETRRKLSVPEFYEEQVSEIPLGTPVTALADGRALVELTVDRNTPVFTYEELMEDRQHHDAFAWLTPLVFSACAIIYGLVDVRRGRKQDGRKCDTRQR